MLCHGSAQPPKGGGIESRMGLVRIEAQQRKRVIKPGVFALARRGLRLKQRAAI
jgi:hypothetical protein